MKQTKKIRPLIAAAALAVLAALVLGWALSPVGPLADDRGEIRNIIVMIPDGGGFGSFDMAEAVKRAGLGIPGMSTPITTDAIAGKTVEGLYLSDYLVGTSVTHSADNPVTDSAAGGTAIATGKKARNDVVALSPDNGTPMVSLLEAGSLAGKATGLVCTKFWYDATPAAFAAHAASRTEYETITMQMLHQGLEVMLGGGTAENYSGTVTAESLGYTVVHDRAELESAVADGAEKVWSSFSAEQGGSLQFDFLLSDGEPTLLEMTKAAIEILSGQEEGFFLMVEGSRVDSGGHNSNALQSSSEYLAFDEAFAYAVNWAMEDGHTLVVAVPDHDTGGLTPRNEAAAIQAISVGTAPEDCSWPGEGYHTGQNVPICVYGPEKAVEELLSTVGLPATGGAENARSGKYYDGVEFDPNYAVDNTMLARGVAQVAELDLKAAAQELFVDITPAGSYADGVFLVETTGMQIPANTAYYLEKNGTRVNFEFGIAVYAGEHFYVPRHVARAVGALTEGK